MIGKERDIRDAPGCPVLGLAADRRTRYTYPHPDHRCYAGHIHGAIKPGRQATYCLSSAFATCDRYAGWARRAGASEGPGLPGSPAAAGTRVGTVIHVWRAGDSLARIAAAYDLTVEQIAAANGLSTVDAIANGQRLVIPLGWSPEPPGRSTRATGG